MRRAACLAATAAAAWPAVAVAQPVDMQAAVLAGDTAAVVRNLDRGDNVNEQGDLGTLLHVAAVADSIAVGRILIDRGADIEAMVEATGMRPLHFAASYGRPSIAALLLDRGAEVDPREISRRTPLVLAATYGYTSVVELLLAHGDNVDAADNCGRTSLNLAILRGSSELTRILLDHGA